MRMAIPLTLAPPFAMAIMVAVSIYAQGSLLPLSISSIDAVLYFKLSFLERSIEKTDAASVELIKAPIKNDSTGFIRRAK